MSSNTPAILVVDDSPEMHLLLEVRLAPEGWRLLYAADAATGLRLAHEAQPDLMLLDLSLPDMRGLEVCRALKADPKTQGIAIVVLSASGNTADKVAAFDAGAADYVQKPFDSEELRARIRAALRAKRYLELLAERAHIDGLTGLWNRAHFDARLEALLSIARRYGRRLSLVLFDIDFFKQINDRFGHPFGDRVLQGIGEVLHQTSRSADSACRYGGEEFALILPETPEDGALLLAERIRERVKQLVFDWHGAPVQVTISAGLASVGPESDYDSDAAALLERADAALYTAKHAGRDRVAKTTATVAHLPVVPNGKRAAQR